MRIKTLACCLALSLGGSPAFAGAWLRETGKAFLATSFTLNKQGDLTNALYLEYGYSPKATFGADLSFGRAAKGPENGTLTLFIRRDLGAKDRKYRLAYELGLGADWSAGAALPHMKATLSWGRGIQISGKSGWATLDASHTHSLGNLANVTKLDATLGLNFSDHYSGMIQIFTSHSDGDTNTSIAPSVILNAAKGKTRYQFGLEAPLSGTADPALKIGLWRDF